MVVVQTTHEVACLQVFDEDFFDEVKKEFEKRQNSILNTDEVFARMLLAVFSQAFLRNEYELLIPGFQEIRMYQLITRDLYDKLDKRNVEEEFVKHIEEVGDKVLSIKLSFISPIIPSAVEKGMASLDQNHAKVLLDFTLEVKE